MSHMTGGCLCSNLRYAADSEPIFSAVCHCKTCQKQTGTAFRVVVAVPRPAVSLQGVQTTFTRMGDSGQQVINRFCPDCGVTVVIEPAALDNITIIPAGTLDETSWLAHDGNLLRRCAVVGPARRWNAAFPENAPCNGVMWNAWDRSGACNHAYCDEQWSGARV